MSSLSIEQKTRIQISALSMLTAYALFAAHHTRPDAAETINELSEAMIEEIGDLFAGTDDPVLAAEAKDEFAEQIRRTTVLAVDMAKKFGGPKSES